MGCHGYKSNFSFSFHFKQANTRIREVCYEVCAPYCISFVLVFFPAMRYWCIRRFTVTWWELREVQHRVAETTRVTLQSLLVHLSGDITKLCLIRYVQSGMFNQVCPIRYVQSAMFNQICSKAYILGPCLLFYQIDFIHGQKLFKIHNWFIAELF